MKTTYLAFMITAVFLSAGCEDEPSLTLYPEGQIYHGENFDAYANHTFHLATHHTQYGDNSCIDLEPGDNCEQGIDRPDSMCDIITFSDHVVVGLMVKNNGNDIVYNYDCMYDYIMYQWRSVSIKNNALLTEGSIASYMDSVMMTVDMDCPAGGEYLMAIKEFDGQHLITHCSRIGAVAPPFPIASDPVSGPLIANRSNIHSLSEALIETTHNYTSACASSGLVEYKETFAEYLRNPIEDDCLSSETHTSANYDHVGGGEEVIVIP